MIDLRAQRGFTIVEALIAVSIFALVAVISTNLLVNVVQLEQKSTVQNALYEDMRVILQQITNEIQNGTVDYEEYYNAAVIESDYLGMNYGAYGSRFYDPGSSLVNDPESNPADLGLECARPEGAPIDECEVLYSLSTDQDTGQNPFAGGGNRPGDANAFCDTGFCNNTDNVFDELYLIDRSGTKKTILGKRLMQGDDYAIGLVRMEGRDNDQNGFIDTFSCSTEFNCFDDAETLANVIELPFVDGDPEKVRELGIRLPEIADLERLFDPNTSQFIPISPMRTTVRELQFIINPLEDPYKAYAEDAVQVHPTVTVVLTVGLSEAAAAEFPGEFSDVTVQTTVSAGVLGRISSYPPTRDVSWLREIGLRATP